VARLATQNARGQVDLVPFVFAWVATPSGERGLGTVVSAIDHKPKTTQRLQRLANIAERPAVTVLVDHYDEVDWSQLWWVRIRGNAREVEDEATRSLAIDALVAKYAQYVDRRPLGPVIEIEVTDVRGWRARPS
jgi:PPOX class probable F420-dependent enzyme